MTQKVRPIREAVEALYLVWETTSIPGAFEACLEELYLAYGREAIEAELKRMKKERVEKSDE